MTDMVFKPYVLDNLPVLSARRTILALAGFDTSAATGLRFALDVVLRSLGSGAHMTRDTVRPNYCFKNADSLYRDPYSKLNRNVGSRIVATLQGSGW